MNFDAKAVSSPPLEVPGASLAAQIGWIMAFGLATAAGARLEIPHEPVPYTLQTLVVLLAGAFLGSRNGAISQLLYLGAGVLGAPVFAGGAFGFARLLGPSGGYLLAFPAAAALVGYLVARRRTLGWTFASMALGLLLIFAAGSAQLYVYTLHDARAAFSAGFLFFSWWDILKLSAAAMIYHELAKGRARLP
jgi:biotin transport system substrate-specific component